MKIRSVRHPGLSKFIEEDDASGLNGNLVRRLQHRIAALVAADSLASLGSMPGWRLHKLTGDRAGTWSISVSGNWRLTFTLDNDEVCDLDLEDYH